MMTSLSFPIPGKGNAVAIRKAINWAFIGGADIGIHRFGIFGVGTLLCFQWIKFS